MTIDGFCDQTAGFLADEELHYHYADLFDLRPIRNYLHTIDSQDRSELHKRLLYWADSYDAIICYKTVTPLRH